MDQASNTKNKAASHCPCNICLPLIAYFSAFETIRQLKERGGGFVLSLDQDLVAQHISESWLCEPDSWIR